MALNKGKKYVISRQSLAFYLTLLRIDYKGRKLQKIDSTIENAITDFLSNFFSHSIIFLITYLNPNRLAGFKDIWLNLNFFYLPCETAISYNCKIYLAIP